MKMVSNVILFSIALCFNATACKKSGNKNAFATKQWTIESCLFSEDRVILSWSPAPENCMGAEIKYTDFKGTTKTVVVPNYRTAFDLLNYNSPGAPFRYRTIYLRDTTSGDTLYSNFVTVSKIPRSAYRLPGETSKYNKGGSRFAGRYRNPDGSIKYFDLKKNWAKLYDGGGRLIDTVTEPVKINKGTEKRMKIDGKKETYIWAWDTNIGFSGWIARADLTNPPPLLVDDDPFTTTNPAPFREAEKALTIHAASATEKLAGLVHRNSQGIIPTGGNKGEHYAGRNPGAFDYIYLLRAVPNVQKGGTSKDSMPDGSLFMPALDEYGRLITEVMTMYKNGDLNKPVNVTFLYGRPFTSTTCGWIARANVGEL